MVDARLRREVIVEPLVGWQDPPAAVPVAGGLALLLLKGAGQKGLGTVCEGQIKHLLKCESHHIQLRIGFE